VLHSHVIDLQCERWLTAAGKGHHGTAAGGLRWPFFGPQTCARFRARPISSREQNHGCRGCWALLRGFGIDISKRELVRLLTTGHDSLSRGKRAKVLRAGLASAGPGFTVGRQPGGAPNKGQ